MTYNLNNYDKIYQIYNRCHDTIMPPVHNVSTIYKIRVLVSSQYKGNIFDFKTYHNHRDARSKNDEQWCRHGVWFIWVGQSGVITEESPFHRRAS